MWRSTFVSEGILRRPIRRKQTDGTCSTSFRRTIQTINSDELNCARSRTFNFNSWTWLTKFGSSQEKFDAWSRPKNAPQACFQKSVFTHVVDQYQCKLHKKRVQLPQDWFGTPTWPPFHCFGTPICRRDVMWKHSIPTKRHTHLSLLWLNQSDSYVGFKGCSESGNCNDNNKKKTRKRKDSFSGPKQPFVITGWSAVRRGSSVEHLEK